MLFNRPIAALAVLFAHAALADDDYYRQQQRQEMYRQQQQQEMLRQQQQQEMYRQQLQQQALQQQALQQQALQQQALARQQQEQRLERQRLDDVRVENARLERQRENETARRRQEREEDEQRDQNYDRQQRERNEAFDRQEEQRRRRLELNRQAIVLLAQPQTRQACRLARFKTVSAAPGLNYSDGADDQVVSYAQIDSDGVEGLVGFTIAARNAGAMSTRFEDAPTSSNVALEYGEECQQKRGGGHSCGRVFRAVRGSVEFEALTRSSAPRGRLIAHVTDTTLLEWDRQQDRPVTGGECLTFEVFNYEATFVPR